MRQRKRITGTTERPRLAVFRSVAHIYAQVIDDTAGRTVAAASSTEPALKTVFAGAVRGGNLAGAEALGKVIAERLREHGISRWCSTAAATSTTAACGRWPTRRARPGWSSRFSSEDTWRILAKRSTRRSSS